MRAAVKEKEIWKALHEFHELNKDGSLGDTEFFKRLRFVLQPLFDFDLFSLYQMDYLDNRPVLVYAHGHPQNLLDAVNFRLGKGAVGWIQKNQKPLLIPDAHREAPHLKNVVNSFLGMPIILNGFLIGIVVMGCFEANKFNKNDQFLLDLLGEFFNNAFIKNEWVTARVRDEVKA